jgi:hypothetical protein
MSPSVLSATLSGARRVEYDERKRVTDSTRFCPWDKVGKRPLDSREAFMNLVGHL